VQKLSLLVQARVSTISVIQNQAARHLKTARITQRRNQTKGFSKRGQQHIVCAVANKF
jgi:hypothetical protein